MSALAFVFVISSRSRKVSPTTQFRREYFGPSWSLSTRRTKNEILLTPV